MNLLVLLLTLLVFSNLFVYILSLANVSPVISLFFFGLLVSNSYIKGFTKEHQHTLNILGDLGLLLLMFIVGLETSFSKLLTNKKKTIFLSIFSFIIPFICGLVLFYSLGNNLLTSFIGGLVMTVTAEAINGHFLMDKGLLRTDIGSTIIGIGLVDDILGILCLSMLLLVFSGLGRDILVSLLIIVFFIGGLYLRKKIPRYNFSNLSKVIKFVLVPFFFVNMGLYFNFNEISSQIGLLLLVSLVAIISKVGSSLISKPFVNFNFKQLHLIGWGISSRGVIGLAVALIALRNKLISKKFYSLMVSMIFITIIVFFIVFSILIKDKHLLENKVDSFNS